MMRDDEGLMRVARLSSRPLTSRYEGDEGDEGEMDLRATRTHMHARTPAHARKAAMETTLIGSSPSSPRPTIRAGRAVVDGHEHVMRVAKPSSHTARRYGLSPNHHVRVWCECQANQVNEPGTLANGIYHRTDRSPEDTAADPRRFGGWDELGFADVRESGSALALFRRHLEEVAKR